MDLRHVVPFEGLGDLRFGMSRSAVRSLLGTNFETFVKGNEPSETDSYDELGLHLYYNKDDKLELIEAFEPCDPIFNGVRLLDDETEAVLHKLTQLGYQARYDNEGYFFDDLGFVLYVPHETIEAVSIYSHGYYEPIR